MKLTAQKGLKLIRSLSYVCISKYLCENTFLYRIMLFIFFTVCEFVPEVKLSCASGVSGLGKPICAFVSDHATTYEHFAY